MVVILACIVACVLPFLLSLVFNFPSQRM
jgi:hypothetical protein